MTGKKIRNSREAKTIAAYITSAKADFARMKKK
jgi:hypothetical protein